jgi:hypothetical protein
MKLCVVIVCAALLCACSPKGDDSPAAEPVEGEVPTTGGDPEPVEGEIPTTGGDPEPASDVGRMPEPAAPPAASDRPAQGTPTAGDPPSPPAVAATDAGPAVAPAVDDACVSDCVARNQMRAVAAEVIEADCRRDCS